MSTVEVSMMTASPKLEPDAERYNRRPQRPPPPPPLQVQPPVSRASQANVLSTLESSPASSEIASKPVETMENESTSLLTQFQRLFDNFDRDRVREKILNRQMIDSPFTTVLWRVFLHCLPRDLNQWNEVLEHTRQAYETLAEEYTIDPYKACGGHPDAEASNHPLSKDENSSWGQYFKDQELKETIIRDVRRSFQDITFFRNQHMIDLQLRILFTHSRHHKQTPYRQGMHEILGIVLYTIHSESFKVREEEESSALMKTIYDARYLEHDAFSIFEKIMTYLRNYYALSSPISPVRKPVSTRGQKQVPFQQLKIVHIPLNENAKQINSIVDSLRTHDKALFDQLEELKIESTVYGTRWLRVMFSREIPFESIPGLWTVIFCFDGQFGFVNHFFIALLIEIGHKIGKHGEIPSLHFLESLMKQNIINNAERVIRQALNLTGKRLELPPEEPSVPVEAKAERRRKNLSDTDGEEKAQPKLIRVPLTRVTEPRVMHPITVQPAKLPPPLEQNASNYQMDTIKATPLTDLSPSQAPKPIVSNPLSDSETEVWAGRTTKQQLVENRQLQENCADYMIKFIDRIEKQVGNLDVSDEEDLQIQIKGLKQIAHILKHNDKFNPSTFEAMIEFKSRKNPSESSSSRTEDQ